MTHGTRGSGRSDIKYGITTTIGQKGRIDVEFGASQSELHDLLRSCHVA